MIKKTDKGILPIAKDIILRDGLYYLSHPATTYGNIFQNTEKSVQIQSNLQAVYGIAIINPLTAISKETSYNEAMDRCYEMYAPCKYHILCPDWEKSKGCIIEAKWSIDKGIKMYFCDGKGLKDISHQTVADKIKTYELKPNIVDGDLSVYVAENQGFIKIKHGDREFEIILKGVEQKKFTKYFSIRMEMENDTSLKEYLEGDENFIFTYGSQDQISIEYIKDGKSTYMFFNKSCALRIYQFIKNTIGGQSKSGSMRYMNNCYVGSNGVPSNSKKMDLYMEIITNTFTIYKDECIFIMKENILKLFSGFLEYHLKESGIIE